MKLEDAIRQYPGRKIRGTHMNMATVICDVPKSRLRELRFFYEDGPENMMFCSIDFDYDWEVIPEVERIVFEGVEIIETRGNLFFIAEDRTNIAFALGTDGPKWKIICEREK